MAGRAARPPPTHQTHARVSRLRWRVTDPARRFADLGSIPLTKRDSIAVGVLARRAGEVMNNVPMVKHVAFFESIKLRDKPVPIQKMVTAPLLVRGQAVGVAEISRKGETPRDAGADFTASDLHRAKEIFDAVAPYRKSDGSPDVIVAFSGGRAFVVCRQRNIVQVFSLQDLSQPPQSLIIAGFHPRAKSASPEDRGKH